MPEEALSSEHPYQGRALSLRVDTVRLASGRVTTREIVEHVPSVVMVPVDGEGNLLMVRQLRHAIDRTILELPAGTTEPGESPEECTRRELREEVGYEPRHLELLGGFYSAPGYASEYLYVFLATDLVANPAVAEDTEYIEPVRYPLTEVPRLIVSGEIEDSKTLAGLYLYWLKKGGGQG